MKVLKKPFEEMGEYPQICGAIKECRTVALSGCVDSQKMHMLYGLSDGFRNKIIVTFSDIKAKELYEDYKFYDRNTVIYPAKDLNEVVHHLNGKEKIEAFSLQIENLLSHTNNIFEIYQYQDILLYIHIF